MRLTANVFRLALIVTAVLAIGLIIAAPFLCVTIFGAEFRDSVADLRVLALGAFGVVALKQLGNSAHRAQPSDRGERLDRLRVRLHRRARRPADPDCTTTSAPRSPRRSPTRPAAS